MAEALYGSQLDNPPTDGITSLRFSRTSDLLLASSWDGTVRLYDAPQNFLRGSYAHGAPVLDSTFQDDSVVFTAGLDNLVKRYDFFGRMESVLGTHDQPVRCVEYLQERGIVATGSWDRTLRLWDPRLGPGQNCVGLIPLTGKVFTMAASSTRLVVGTSDRQVLIYDLRSIHTGQAVQKRESLLKYQTRCIRCYPDGTGYALCSVEGRVAMEYFDLSAEVQARKYAFKCHRKTEEGKETIYSVNSMAFHPIHGTFATGGCDGVVNFWDGGNQKRLHQISKYPTSIASMAFNKDGSLLAVGASYTFENGEQDHPADAIYLRKMHDFEVRPKPRTK